MQLPFCGLNNSFPALWLRVFSSFLILLKIEFLCKLQYDYNSMLIRASIVSTVRHAILGFASKKPQPLSKFLQFLQEMMRKFRNFFFLFTAIYYIAIPLWRNSQEIAQANPRKIFPSFSIDFLCDSFPSSKIFMMIFWQQQINLQEKDPSVSFLFGIFFFFTHNTIQIFFGF